MEEGLIGMKHCTGGTGSHNDDKLTPVYIKNLT